MAGGASAVASSPFSPNNDDDYHHRDHQFSLVGAGSSSWASTEHVSASSSLPIHAPSAAVATPSTSAVPAALTASGPTTSNLSSALGFFPILSAMAGFITAVFYFFFRFLPGVLYNAITFLTITLPTWLFTLFSMSLTVTMNFTTLYVFSPLFCREIEIMLTDCPYPAC